MKVGIIGAGKIGMTIGEIASEFSEVIYVDKKPEFINDYAVLVHCDIIFLAVNTAFENHYDMSNITDCLIQIKKHDLKNVIILSTCPPSFFDSQDFKDCSDHLIYSPLFIRQGTIRKDIFDAEFILIGSNKDSIVLKNFYNKIRNDYKFIELEFKEAAVVKMAINGFLTLKVAYANMIGDYCVLNSLNVDSTLLAISQCKSINSHYFKYGYGFGGPCLPIDNITLASEIGKDLPLSVDLENDNHLNFMVEKFCRENVIGPNYIFDNVAYKEGVPIIIKSQKLMMANLLTKKGYQITIKDTSTVCDLVKEAFPNVFLFDEIN